MPKLILASTSPFRRELLERLNVPFEVESPETDETPLPDETPLSLVRRLAIAKASAIAANADDALVIGSDQVAIHGGEIVGKPHTHENAVAQLKAASGTVVRLLTGVAVINTREDRIQSDVIPFSVTFRTLDDLIIEQYLRAEQPYGCAGSLKAEGLGIALLEKFDGDDPTALIGLPLIRVIEMLRSEGFEPLHHTRPTS